MVLVTTPVVRPSTTNTLQKLCTYLYVNGAAVNDAGTIETNAHDPKVHSRHQ